MATNSIKKRYSKFTQVSNSFLRDNNISFKAKGLFCYMFSMADGWNFTMQSIATQQKDGVASVSSAMNELKEFGYVKYEKHSDGKGTYYLDDEPKRENPDMDNTRMGKSDAIKNKQLSKNNNNKNISLLSDYVEADDNITENGKNEILEFIEYRKKIKKPIRTIAPIKAYVKVIRELIKDGYKLEDIKDLMHRKEWQNIEAEWVRKSIKKDDEEERYEW